MAGNTIPEFDPSDLQWALMAVSETWQDHDKRALGYLSDGQLREQVKARRALYNFVGDYRERAKATDDQAVYHAPEWKVAAGLKDLFAAMLAVASDMQYTRSEESDDD